MAAFIITVVPVPSSVYRSIGDITLLIEEIVPILMLSVTDIASSDLMPKRVVRKPSLGTNKFLLVALKQGFGLPYPWVGPELDGGSSSIMGPGK